MEILAQPITLVHTMHPTLVHKCTLNMAPQHPTLIPLIMEDLLLEEALAFLEEIEMNTAVSVPLDIPGVPRWRNAFVPLKPIVPQEAILEEALAFLEEIEMNTAVSVPLDIPGVPRWRNAFVPLKPIVLRSVKLATKCVTK